MSTFNDWIKQYNAQVEASEHRLSTAELVQAAQAKELAYQADVIEQYAEVRRKALQAAIQDKKIDEAPFDKLLLGAGIADTKIAEFAGITPAKRELFLAFEHECTLNGYDVRDILNDGLTKMKAQRESKLLSVTPAKIEPDSA